VNVAEVGRYLVTKHGTKPWCYGRWFCIVMNPVWPFKSDIPLYVKNDGTASGRMQVDVLDGTGGTYFLTKEDAEAAAKRFNDHHANVKQPLDSEVSNAPSNETDQSDTKETTNKTKDTETKAIKRKVKRADT
jgi:hypothetical protein